MAFIWLWTKIWGWFASDDMADEMAKEMKGE